MSQLSSLSGLTPSSIYNQATGETDSQPDTCKQLSVSDKEPYKSEDCTVSCMFCTLIVKHNIEAECLPGYVLDSQSKWIVLTTSNTWAVQRMSKWTYSNMVLCHKGSIPLLVSSNVLLCQCTFLAPLQPIRAGCVTVIGSAREACSPKVEEKLSTVPASLLSDTLLTHQVMFSETWRRRKSVLRKKSGELKE